MPLSSVDLDLLVQIASRQVELLACLRKALEAGDTLLALDLARELCGMGEGETEQ
jgi:hypothetical protein